MRTASTRTRVALTAALLLAVPALARAQATGTLSGVVTDPTGAVLPGATVEARNQGTGQLRNATTSGDGVYTIPLLAPGDYELKASLAGFTTLTRSSVRVTVAETARVNLALQTGARTENITIVEQAPLVETANGTLGIVIDQKKVVDLPLNGRRRPRRWAA